MLRDLTIQNYRVFKDFSIDGLARVNLIVGMNNSGKTSFLEAVYLLAKQGQSPCIFELMHSRGEFIEPASQEGWLVYPFNYMLNGYRGRISDTGCTEKKDHP